MMPSWSLALEGRIQFISRFGVLFSTCGGSGSIGPDNGVNALTWRVHAR